MTLNIMLKDVEQAAESLDAISSRMEDPMRKSGSIIDVMKN